MEFSSLRKLWARKSGGQESSPADTLAVSAPSTEPRHGMSRRDLLKLGAVAGAAAVLDSFIGRSGDARAETPLPASDAGGAAKSAEAPKTEAATNPEVKRAEAIKEAKELLKICIASDIAKRGIYELNLDHAFLAFGNEPVIDGKSLIGLGAGPHVERHYPPYFSRYQSAHRGAISYSFLRTGIPFTEKMRAENGKRIAVGDLIKRDLGEIGEVGEFDTDYEWALLIVAEMKKRGQTVQARNRKGKVLPIAELVRLNQEELDFKLNPGRLSEDAKIRLKVGDGGTCNSEHALHALASYSVQFGDTTKLAEVIGIAFEQLRYCVSHKYKNDDYYALKDGLHKVAHILTIFTELPANHQFIAEQRVLLKKGINFCEDKVMRYRASLDEANKDAAESDKEKIDLGTLSHVVDALKNLPVEFLK